jgi:hypothetical protein
MPSQLFVNDKIGFLACKPFTYRGEPYEMGDEFPQEEANNIETLVRARFVIPFVEDVADKPRHWHGHIRTREQAEEYLNRDRVQLVMPEPYDSDEVVNLNVLTRPETTPDPADDKGESGEGTPAQAVHDETYDPTYHTVNEVNDYLAVHPEDRERILEVEESNRGRKGILEA